MSRHFFVAQDLPPPFLLPFSRLPSTVKSIRRGQFTSYNDFGGQPCAAIFEPVHKICFFPAALSLVRELFMLLAGPVLALSRLCKHE